MSASTEMAVNWRKLHNYNCHDLYTSPKYYLDDYIRQNKVWHIAQTGEKRNRAVLWKKWKVICKAYAYKGG